MMSCDVLQCRVMLCDENNQMMLPKHFNFIGGSGYMAVIHRQQHKTKSQLNYHGNTETTVI